MPKVPGTSPCLALPLVLLLALGGESSAEDRVARARASKAGTILALFSAAGVSYPPKEVYLRVFKLERQLELWAGSSSGPLKLIKTYRICAQSGSLGPKREEGDDQVPEGFYRVAGFNPFSRFHLALALDYPNEADRILGKTGKLGGEIMIHGDCVTIGCIPIEDDPIEEVYLIAWDARRGGNKEIPVHIFPRRLDEGVGMAALVERYGATSTLLQFWRTLQPAYVGFERSKRPPRVSVDSKTGEYQVHSF